MLPDLVYATSAALAADSPNWVATLNLDKTGQESALTFVAYSDALIKD